MLKKLLDLFRGRPLLVQGADQMPSGHSKRIDVGDPLAGGRQIILCRVGDEFYAVDNECPHESGRMVDGPLVEDKYVLCPLHSYRFDPKTGESVGVACKKAKTYPVTRKGSDCEIRI